MEIKAVLKKPYNYKERAFFVSKWGNYEIRETNNELQVWGMTQEEQEAFELENKKENVKRVRNSMLEDIEWRVARAREQRELGIKTVDNYYNLIHYKQYLRDYPDEVENWWEQNPLEFEEWEKQYEYRQES